MTCSRTLIFNLLLTLIWYCIHANANTYTLQPVTANSETIWTPANAGVVKCSVYLNSNAVFFGHQGSNALIWLRYLNPTLIRTYVAPPELQPVSDEQDWKWKTFVSNAYSVKRRSTYGDQFGVSFQGNAVTSKAAWLAAVDELRLTSNSPDKPEFFEWLVDQKSVDWVDFLNKTRNLATHLYEQQRGTAEWTLESLTEQGYQIMALWAVDCVTFPYTSRDPNTSLYWKERYESYRLHYIGGRYLARFNISMVELYNEPDIQHCIDAQRWGEDALIRSQATQDAYIDYAKQTMVPPIQLQLIAPSLAKGWLSDYGTVIASNMKKRYFAASPYSPQLASYRFMDIYGMHRYGDFTNTSCPALGKTCRHPLGNTFRKSYDDVREQMKRYGYGSLPVSITEFNCFTSRVSDLPHHAYFQGRNNADSPDMSACTAAQIASLMSKPYGPTSIVMQKFGQNFTPWKPARQIKNGLFYFVPESPYDVTGSTKVGEMYRLVLRKAAGKHRVYRFRVLHNGGAISLSDVSGHSVSAWAIADDPLAYYIYLTNEDYKTHTINLNISPFRAENNNFTAIISAVAPNPSYATSTFHGEVAYMKPIQSGTSSMSLTVPKSSFYMITIPKVLLAVSPSTGQTVFPIVSSADSTLGGGSQGQHKYGTNSTLLVSSSDQVYASIIKFDVNSTTDIVSAILQLTLLSSTNSKPQILTVLGVDGNWDESTVSWDSIDALKPDAQQPITAYDNFIRWSGDKSPTVVGHVTVPPGRLVPPGGANIRLDVTDHLRDGQNSFLVVRMNRHDASIATTAAQLSADVLQGIYMFASREGLIDTQRPQLLIQRQLVV